MGKTQTNHETGLVQQKPLRLWPGFLVAALMLLLKFFIPSMVPDAMPIVTLGGAVLGLLMLVWWAFFSRATRLERWGGLVLVIIGLLAVRPFLHKSIAEGGMGILFPVLALPTIALALFAAALISLRMDRRKRRIVLAAGILIACGAWTLIRTGGVTNEGDSDFFWRWKLSPEEALLKASDKPEGFVAETIPRDTAAVWPGFRGPHRDSIIRGVMIETDWATTPPEELWRQPVGPGWSSFAATADLFYTQEQRGEEEAVSCYRIETGELVWMHRDQCRFWESNGGAGPRGTPTLKDGRIYTLGAKGIVNVLDARDGRVIWSRNAAEDTETEIPIWGLASSPLVLDSLVIVAPASAIIAYNKNTGEPLWSHPGGVDCYSSPHLWMKDGDAQILFQNQTGIFSLDPADGSVLWDHEWKGYPIVQPALTADGDILASVDEQSGIKRISAEKGPEGWTVSEKWSSKRLKPYFNDSVIHEGHVYGFDGPSLACITVNGGERAWKGGRYGRGQMLLLADQDLLIVISEKGDLVLVRAVPEAFAELARIPALTGKTWNHPVLAGDVLLVRNAEEMAAFRLRVQNPAKEAGPAA